MNSEIFFKSGGRIALASLTPNSGNSSPLSCHVIYGDVFTDSGRCLSRPVQLPTRHRAGTSIVLANISRLRYVAIATQLVHRLQIRPIVHNYGASSTTPPSYIRVRAIVWACVRGQTDRHTHRRARPQYISRSLRLTRNVMNGVK